MKKMRSTPSRYQQQGFSLVELMVAITLSLVLTLGVIEVFTSSNQTNRTQSALGNLQENARLALDMLSYDIRMAGNLGCNSSAAVTNSTADTNLLNIGNGIQGYEYGTLPAVLLLNDANSTSKNPGQGNIVSNTDAIVIRYASPNTLEVTNSGSATVTTTDLNGNTITTTTDSVTLAANTTAKAGDPFIISDCSNADIFIASSDVNNGNIIQLANGQALSKSYGIDAEVAPLKYVAYYIRPFTDSNGITRNNLYRSIVSGKDNIDTDPLLEGVEDFQVLYGEDLNGSNIRYVPADTAGLDMNRVTSVRISLLFSTIDNNIASGDQSYWLNGDLVKVAAKDNADKKLLRGVTTTIQLRN